MGDTTPACDPSAAGLRKSRCHAGEAHLPGASLTGNHRNTESHENIITPLTCSLPSLAERRP